IDAQTGQRSNTPLHDGTNGVHAIPLNPNRHPIPSSAPKQSGSGNPGPSKPTGEDRRPPAEPAGGKHKAENESPDGSEGPSKPKKPKRDSAEKRRQNLADSERRFDSSEYKGSAEYNTAQEATDTHDGMLGDDAQRRLRQTHDVLQMDIGPVVDAVHRWAEPKTPGTEAPLLQAVREIKAHGALDVEHLNTILPGFRDLDRHQRMAALAGIARLSNAVHREYSPLNVPVKEEGAPNGGVRIHDGHSIKGGSLANDPKAFAREYAARQSVPKSDDDSKAAKEKRLKDINVQKRRLTALWTQEVEKAADDIFRPDMSGRNYMALEVTETDKDGNSRIHYVIDSSVPPGSAEGDEVSAHSEPLGGEALRRAQATNPDRQFKLTGLYTEYEPCGNSGELGGQGCSHYISENLERPAKGPGSERTKFSDLTEQQIKNVPDEKSGVEVSYAIPYRYGDVEADTLGENEATVQRQENLKIKWGVGMNQVRGELLIAWDKAIQTRQPQVPSPAAPSQP
ncbi:hypothetical protein, partial [Streptomyces lydicus]|uniref:hypothetical protein n=1 Tax=Streptomyces lydicus TaxID=47763 RepID=UPI0037F569DE